MKNLEEKYGLTLTDYKGGKSFVIRGDLRGDDKQDIREHLKNNGCRFNYRLEGGPGWICSLKKKDDILAFNTKKGKGKEKGKETKKPSNNQKIKKILQIIKSLQKVVLELDTELKKQEKSKPKKSKLKKEKKEKSKPKKSKLKKSKLKKSKLKKSKLKKSKPIKLKKEKKEKSKTKKPKKSTLKKGKKE